MNKMIVLLIIVSITACSSKKNDITIAEFTEIEWELSSIQNDSILSEFRQGRPTITFNKNNTIAGFGGCNNYSSEYEIDTNGNIDIALIMSTKMYCGKVPENNYYTALRNSEKIKVSKEELVLANSNNEKLTFKRK